MSAREQKKRQRNINAGLIMFSTGIKMVTLINKDNICNKVIRYMYNHQNKRVYSMILAKETKISYCGCSKVIKDLIKCGFIINYDENSKRVKYLKFTEKGIKLAILLNKLDELLKGDSA